MAHDHERILDHEAEEQAYLERVVHAFESYEEHTFRLIKRKELWVQELPAEDRALIEAPWQSRMREVKRLVMRNGMFLRTAVAPSKMFENSTVGPSEETKRTKPMDVSEADMDKVRSMIRQLAREWSEEGGLERDEAFVPICQAVEEVYQAIPDGRRPERNQFYVLVPGAGLGRLPWELASRGFSAQGNEFSYFCLLLSNHILNHCRKDQAEIFPYVTTSNNIREERDVLRSVVIPDVDPTQLKRDVDFSMCAGEFFSAYENQVETFHVVVTCFFIDTAHNIIAYLRRIYQLLKPGGYWINLGPLLYHFADMFSESSVELTLEEVISVAEKLGFSVGDVQYRYCHYTSDQRSMLETRYNACFFLARKGERM